MEFRCIENVGKFTEAYQYLELISSLTRSRELEDILYREALGFHASAYSRFRSSMVRKWVPASMTLCISEASYHSKTFVKCYTFCSDNIAHCDDTDIRTRL